MRKLIVSILLVAASANLWPQSIALAEPAKAAAADEKQKPQPKELLRRMANYLCSIHAFGCKVEFLIDLKASGMSNRTNVKADVRFERPNRIAQVIQDGVTGVTVVSDGKQLVQFVPTLNRYSVDEAPSSVWELIKSIPPLSLSMMGLPGGAFFGDSGEEFYKSLVEGLKGAEYIGKEKLGDRLCDHCKLQYEDGPALDIWIEAGEHPVPRKVAFDMSKELANAGDKYKDAKYELSFTNSDWNVAPKFTDADFTFKPPANAEKVDSIFERPSEDEEGPHPLLGKPAPPFETVDLDGHPFNLKTYLGKKIILLDFWATWCGPCVEAMPNVDAVAKKFANKGLVFRAVNAGEDAATIKEFLESSKLDPPVAMDTKGEVAEAYKVSGIPQTVLIGKDGKVQVVHVGFGPNLVEILSKEIEDLLAGKDLAGPVVKKAEEARKKREATKSSKPATNNTESAAPAGDAKPPTKE